MSGQAVRYECAEGVARLTMDQPNSRNALTPALLDGLGDGLNLAQADPQVRAIVLTHTGPAFCAGADMSDRAGSAPEPKIDLAGVLAAILDSPKPVLARIAGHCMGGGVGLAAACDLAVASNGARFGFTEVRVGVAPAIISVVCLPKLRRADALELYLTGERISATRAAEVGLISAAVPEDELDPAVSDLLAKVLAGGPLALAAAKQLVLDGPGPDRAAAFRRTTEISEALFASAEAAEGMAAFREKRKPSWAP
jgi:methylglutaconyl-CoA hydratase